MNSQQLLRNSGHETLLPLQEATITAFKENDHVALMAQTGSGKTLAFLLGIVQKLQPQKTGTQALILAPTRELALQIAGVYKSLRTDYTSTVCYGGHPVKTERNELAQNPSVIIATPGRILDHLEREHIDLRDCDTVVIDEFDKCLEFGFESEMSAIRAFLPDTLYTLFVSATKLTYVPEAWKFEETKTLEFHTESKPEGLKQWAVEARDIFESLVACLTHFGNEPSVVFCNYREVVEDVAERLTDEGLSCVAYHGGMDQQDREMALIKFRNRSVHTLVCTDLGSRGLDIEDIEHVVHYQFPDSEAAYIHRNGRTARANKQGNAYILFKETQELPQYLTLPETQFTPSTNKQARSPEWTTLYFGGGKKDKLRKLDVVGFLSQQGKLKQNEIGKIDVLDRMTFVAIANNRLKDTLNNIHMKRIKGKRFVIKKAK